MFHESICKNDTHMATIAEGELIATRICQRVTKRSNISAGSSKDYLKVPVLIPRNIQDMSSMHRDNVFQFKISTVWHQSGVRLAGDGKVGVN